MRSRLLVIALAASLVAGLGTSVLAQRRSTDEAFGWPLQEWQRGMEALTLETESQLSKTLPKPKVVRKGPASSGAVALTFDDGYSVEACASIADTLREHGAVGTFFINGQWLQQQPKRWRDILEGMEVANHTRSHRNLEEAPDSVVINQIRSNEYVHESLLGRPMLKVLRPPYGAYDRRVGQIAKELGYDQIVLWNVDTGDWKPGAKRKSIIRAATDRAPGSIILMHCAHEATARALPQIVRHYQRRGIEVAGLSKVLRGAKGSKATAERYDQ
jgi:peptidoglycan/xylan/chitin deacetylase (PgdA/CDA1 family)